MSSFTTELVATPLSNGRDWRLVRKFRYHIGSKYSRRIISVPKDFVTDFASVPRIFFFLPDWATYNKSPVLHDWLYRVKVINGELVTRKEADDIFYEAMLVSFRRYGIMGKIIAFIEYYAVRIAGGLAWEN